MKYLYHLFIAFNSAINSMNGLKKSEYHNKLGLFPGFRVKHKISSTKQKQNAKQNKNIYREGMTHAHFVLLFLLRDSLLNCGDGLVKLDPFGSLGHCFLVLQIVLQIILLHPGTENIANINLLIIFRNRSFYVKFSDGLHRTAFIFGS